MKALFWAGSPMKVADRLFDGQTGFRYPNKSALICGNGLRARKAEHFNKYG